MPQTNAEPAGKYCIYSSVLSTWCISCRRTHRPEIPQHFRQYSAKSFEFRLAKKLLHKSQDSNIWFIKIVEILQTYNMTNPFDLMENPQKRTVKKNFPKRKWKHFGRKSPGRYCRKELPEMLGNINSYYWQTSFSLDHLKGNPKRIWKRRW